MTAPTNPIERLDTPLPVVEADVDRLRKQQLAADLEATRVALLTAGRPEEAHAWLDADPDTAWPLPGVAHPKTPGGQR